VIVSARVDSAARLGVSASGWISVQADLEERTICLRRLKRMRDALLPLLEHAITYLHEFGVRFHVGVYFLRGVRNRSPYAFEYVSDAGRGPSHPRLTKSLQFLRARPFRRAVEGKGHTVKDGHCSADRRGETKLKLHPGKTSTFILYIFPASVVPEAAPELPFQSHRNLCSYGSQSSQGLSFKNPLRLPSRNYLVYLLIFKR